MKLAIIGSRTCPPIDIDACVSFIEKQTPP